MDSTKRKVLLAGGDLVTLEEDEVTLCHWLGEVDAKMAAGELLVDLGTFVGGLSESSKVGDVKPVAVEVYFRL